MLSINSSSPSSVPTPDAFTCAENATATNKRKRRPAGTPGLAIILINLIIIV